MIRREKKYEFSLIISLESLINQSVWGGVEFSQSHILYVFTQLFRHEQVCDTRSFIKQTIAVLNAGSLFSWNGYLTKAEEPCLS